MEQWVDEWVDQGEAVERVKGGAHVLTSHWLRLKGNSIGLLPPRDQGKVERRLASLCIPVHESREFLVFGRSSCR